MIRKRVCKKDIIKLLEKYEYSQEELCDIQRVIWNKGEFRQRFLQPKKKPKSKPESKIEPPPPPRKTKRSSIN